MFKWFARWLEKRRREKEREAFAWGYLWAKHCLDKGSHSPEALEAMSYDAFNKFPGEHAFDRGVFSAVEDHRAVS